MYHVKIVLRGKIDITTRTSGHVSCFNLSSSVSPYLTAMIVGVRVAVLLNAPSCEEELWLERCAQLE